MGQPAFSAAQLVVRHTGQRIPLAQTPLTIGREPDNLVVLTDPQVSRHHAIVSYQAGSCVVQDMGSANGVHVNDRRIVTPQVLHSGDVLRIGNTFLEVQLTGDTAQAMAPPAAAPVAPGYPLPGAPAYPPAQAARRSPVLPVLGLVGVLIVVALLAVMASQLLKARPGGPPVVTLDSPLAGTQVGLGAKIALQAGAGGARDLVRLEVLVDDVPVAVATSPDAAGTSSLFISQLWAFGQAGPHVVSARATTAGGTVAAALPVSVEVVEIAGPGTPVPPTPGGQATSIPAETLVPTLPPAASTTTPAPIATTAPPPPSPTVASGGTRPAGPGPIADFEAFGTWKRGDQPNGAFTQSTEQVHGGAHAGKLAYNFPTAGNDYVVFTQAHKLGGRPNQISAWVYGDGSGHYLDVWVLDAAGETWQFPLGKVKHTGWLEVAARLDPAAAWPAGHIDGPSNGAIDYPLDFRGLVLDDVPDGFAGSGALYVDDLRCDEVSGPTPTPYPTATRTPTPTATATAGPTPSPIIEFWADHTTISAGESTVLHWHVEHVREVYLDGDPVTGPVGKKKVKPSSTTTYRLRVVYAGGEEIREITITVTP